MICFDKMGETISLEAVSALVHKIQGQLETLQTGKSDDFLTRKAMVKSAHSLLFALETPMETLIRK